MSQNQTLPPTPSTWRQSLDQLHDSFSQALKLSALEDYESLKPVLNRIADIFPRVVQPPESVTQDDCRQINEVLNLHSTLINLLDHQRDRIGNTLSKITQGKQMLTAYSRNQFKT